MTDVRPTIFRHPDGGDQAILIYCSKGLGWCELRSRRHEVAAGSLLVVPRGEPHSYGAAPQSPWTISWFHATGDELIPLLAELGVTGDRPVLPLTGEPQWLARFEDALNAVERGSTTSPLLRASQSLAQLLSATIFQHKKQASGATDAQQTYVRCVEFMQRHLDQPLRVSQLAALAKMSPSRFKAGFKQHTGCACIEYFIRLRIRYACQLLDTTELSAKIIASEVGYADPLWFSKAFRAVTGMPPSDYRRKSRGLVGNEEKPRRAAHAWIDPSASHLQHPIHPCATERHAHLLKKWAPARTSLPPATAQRQGYDSHSHP